MAKRQVGHENEAVKKLGQWSRDSQKWAAGLIPGLRPIINQANAEYYPRDTDHNGNGDAMRHLMLQAGLTQQYGKIPAQMLGWLHENMSIGQPEAEYEMDAYNDVLGRKLGGLGLATPQLEQRARQYVDQGTAKTLPQGEDGYKDGGQVHQPSKMNNTFMAGGLNLINPKNKSKGPLNIAWNTNNLIAASRKNSIQ